MKKNFLNIILFFFAFLFVSCSENITSENNLSKYDGTWLWLKTVGGFGPTVSTPKEGITIKISFDNRNTFKLFRNDSLKVIANYNIVESEHDRDEVTYSNVTTYDFNFNSESDFVQVRTDTLDIWDGMIDGYFSFYKKIN